MAKAIRIGVFAGLPVAVFLSFFGYSLLQPARIDYLFVTFSYFILLAVCAVWIVNALRLYERFKFPLRRVVSNSWRGLLFCLLITISLCSAVKPHFRVLDDETSLLSVSNSLAREHKARGVTHAKYLLGRDYIVLEQYIPKRPLLYPFLVHITHLVRGQHWQNGFILNAILLFACLALVYVGLRNHLDDWGAMAGVLLVLGNPIFIISARSSGFDFLSVFIFLLSLAGMYIFLRRPGPVSFGFLWSTLVLFSHIRYENVYLFVLAISCVALFGRMNKELIKNNYLLIAWTPALLLPYIWQLYLSRSFFGDGIVSRAFGADYLVANSKRFALNQSDLGSLFDTTLSDFTLPVAVVIGVWMLFRALQRELRVDDSAYRQFLVFLVLVVGIHLLILLSFYFGDFTLTYMQRIYLPVFSLLALVPLMTPWLFGTWINTRIVFIIAALLFALYLPVSLFPQRTGLFYPDLEHQIEFLRSYNPKTTLIVTARPVRLNALGFGAVSFDYMNNNKQTFINDIQLKSFTDVIVFQRVNHATKAVDDGDWLSADFLLESLQTFRTAPHQQTRISRIKASLPR